MCSEAQRILSDQKSYIFMAGDAFSIKIDDAQVRARLRELADQVQHPKAVMQDIARALVDITEDAFANETSPFGQKWPDLDEDYVEHPRKDGGRGGDAHPILKRTGQMAASVYGRSGNDYAEVGVAKGYATVHQFGADIQHPARASTVYFKLSRDKKSVGTKFVSFNPRPANWPGDATVGVSTLNAGRRVNVKMALILRYPHEFCRPGHSASAAA